MGVCELIHTETGGSPMDIALLPQDVDFLPTEHAFFQGDIALAVVRKDVVS